MKRPLVLSLAALAISSSAFAEQIDFHPNGYVSAMMREAKAEQRFEANADKTAAQIRAETLEAGRLGLLNATEAGAREPTAEQARQIEQAGLRARAFESALK